MEAKLFHHAVYKRSMNTVILVFSRGADPQCTLTLEPPESLLYEPMCVYRENEPVPQLLPLLSRGESFPE